ncbi:MAG: hypothetical protein M3Z46_12610, partial [Actinomycetota bacterium]|nr:hypothetical protein [Actinomycetota bacterium]
MPAPVVAVTSVATWHNSTALIDGWDRCANRSMILNRGLDGAVMARLVHGARSSTGSPAGHE